MDLYAAEPAASMPAVRFTQPWSSKEAVNPSNDKTFSALAQREYDVVISYYATELKKLAAKAKKTVDTLHESLQKLMQEKKVKIHKILHDLNLNRIPRDVHESRNEAYLDGIWLDLHRMATSLHGVPGVDALTAKAPGRSGRSAGAGVSIFAAPAPVSVRPAATMAPTMGYAGLPAAFVSMPASMRPLPAVPDLVPVPAATRPSAAAALQPPNKRQRPESAPERDGVDIAEAAREFQRLLDFLSNLIAAGLPQEAARTKLAELGARFPELGARFPELHERYVSLVAPKRNRWGPPVAPATGGSRRRRRGSRRGSRSSRSSRRRGSRSRRGSRRGSRRRRLTRKL
jgi:hypothetical protein